MDGVNWDGNVGNNRERIEGTTSKASAIAVVALLFI